MTALLAAPGLLINAGSGTSALSANTVIPANNFPMSFSLVNYHSTSLTTPIVTVGMSFAPGDIPSGSRLKMVSAGGTTIVMQEDAVASWPDGSRKFSALSFTSPDNFTANGTSGATNTYTLSVEAVAPNNTPSFTLSQFLANHDPKVLFTGFDCGSNTFECSLAQITSTFAPSPYEGNYPLASAAAAGATSITLSTGAANVSPGMLVTGLGVAASTLVQSVSGSTVTLNTALTTGVGAGVPLHFGSALGGWEQICSGPNCCEWHAWCYLYCPALNAYHTQVRCDIYVRAWSAAGACEIYAQLRVPNIYGNIPAGTLGPSGVTSKRFVCNATVQDGSTILYYFGGANDPRSFSISASQFVISNNVMCLDFTSETWPNWLHVQTGGCQPVSFLPASGTGNSLPGGCTTSTECWVVQSGTVNVPVLFGRKLPNANQIGQGSPGYTGGAPWQSGQYYGLNTLVSSNYAFYICQTAGGTASIQPTGNGPIVDGGITWYLLSAFIYNGTAGTGNVLCCPTIGVHPLASVILATASCEPIWSPGNSGVTARPFLMPGYNQQYRFQKTKAVLPYDYTKTTYPRTDCEIVSRGYYYNTYTEFSPGQPQPGVSSIPSGYYWNISIYGDSPGDERVGPIPNSSANLEMQPTDPLSQLVAYSIALGFADHTHQLMNEISGQFPLTTAGHYRNPSAAPYAGLGPIDIVTQTSAIAIFASGSPATTPYSGGPDWGGHYMAYAGPVDDQHMPNPYYVPYLRTGHRIYFDNMQALATNVVLCSSNRSQNVGTHTFYGGLPYDPSNVPRAMAWTTKIVSQVNQAIPDNYIAWQYVNDYLDDTAELFAEYFTQGNLLAIDAQFIGRPLPQGTPLGFLDLVADSTGGTTNAISTYMVWFLGIIIGWEAWKDQNFGKRPQWAEYLAKYFSRIAINIFNPALGGGYYNCGIGTAAICSPYIYADMVVAQTGTLMSVTVNSIPSSVASNGFFQWTDTPTGKIGYQKISGISGNTLSLFPGITPDIGTIAVGTTLYFGLTADGSQAVQTPTQFWQIPYNGSGGGVIGEVVPPTTTGIYGYGTLPYAGNSYSYDTNNYSTIYGACLGMMAWANVPGAQTAFNGWKAAVQSQPGYQPIVWGSNGSQPYDLGGAHNYCPWMIASPGATLP